MRRGFKLKNMWFFTYGESNKFLQSNHQFVEVKQLKTLVLGELPFRVFCDVTYP